MKAPFAVGSCELRVDLAQATVTELAQVPDNLADGPCLLAWQEPALAGDAAPSRPFACRHETLQGPAA